MAKRLAVGVTVLVVLALVAGGVLWWRAHHRTDLERAVSLAPAATQRLSWTHWAAVRAEVGADLSASSSGEEVTGFLNDGYDTDLLSSSALVSSAAVMQDQLGFSPATLDWELFGQSEDGAAVIMKLAESADFDELADTLESVGFTRPSSDTGVWEAGPTVLAQISPELSPELQYLALDADRGLVLASDTGGYAADAMATVTGDADSLEGLEDVVAGTGEPLSAAIYTGDNACAALAMSQADEPDQAQADELLAVAGEVDPILGFAMSVQPDRDVRVLMSFANDEQARTNADTRRALASGPAAGQGGDFADRFTIRSATAEDELVRLELDPVEGSYVLSDLSNGPVLFATC